MKKFDFSEEFRRDFLGEVIEVPMVIERNAQNRKKHRKAKKVSINIEAEEFVE